MAPAIEDRPPLIRKVADVIRKHGLRLLSILTSYECSETGFTQIVIRGQH